MSEIDVIRISELPEKQNSEDIWILGETGDGESVRVKINPLKEATSTAGGLMSAADKTTLDKLASKTPGMKTLVASTLASGGIVDGGKAYRISSNSSYTIAGVGIFTDDADMCTITTLGNTSVTFSSTFKPQKDLSSVTGTVSQIKLYTIQRVPMPGDNTKENIYLVNCSLYG